MARVRHVLDTAELHKLLRSPNGAVARDILRRTLRVESAAKRNLGGGGGSGPKRVNTGRLRASITHQLLVVGDKPVGRVGTNVKYARYVHDGTGVYGPRHTPIRPKRAKVLRWTSRGGQVVFAARSRGMQPNHFLRNALRAART